MPVVSNPHKPPSIIEQTLAKTIKIYKSLRPKPTTDNVETAISTLKTLDTELKTKLEQISNQVSPNDLPSDIFSLLQAVSKTMELCHSYEKSKEATQLGEIDQMFKKLDELIEKAGSFVSEDAQIEKQRNWGDPVEENDQKCEFDDGILMKNGEDGNFEKNSLEGLVIESSFVPKESASKGGDTENMSLMKVATLFESYAKTGASVLNLQGKLMDQIEWLPLSLAKLSTLIEINISENQIMALPSNLGELQMLKKFDIHSNQLINLPGSIGELVNLSDLDLHANRLKSLPTSFGNLRGLTILDLSCNLFIQLPDSIGNLSSLKKFNVEMNDLEELPYTIGSCTSLVELRLDFNRLKALPETIGNLGNLQILTLRYNRVKNLPTTMGNLQSLVELNLSFNELESVPECLCSIVSLRKLNVGNNFADLKSLPRSIGNLEMLEELDISNDQIRVLPDSFRFLLRLRVFHADETPLEIPPRQIPELGAQAVVQYIAEHVDSKRNTFSNKVLKKRGGLWSCILSCFCLDEALSTERN